jgi:diguanylate cyclase (GGDEF)-like protein
MPIRFRILVVALIAVLSVGAGFYREYSRVRDDAGALEAEQARVVESMALSALVHELQKERGLTATALADPSIGVRERRDAQRIMTDAALAEAVRAGASALGDAPDATLKRLRAAADSGRDWAGVRQGYSSTIGALLDRMAANGQASAGAVRGSPLPPLAELALARENLGLARATLNRIYTRGSAAGSELTELAGYYGGYSENLRIFLRDIGARAESGLAAQVPVALRAQVLEEMGNVLERGGVGRSQAPRAQRWWDGATRLIDGYKTVEDGIYRDYLAGTRKTVEARRAQIAVTLAVAMTATVLVAVLTALAVVRILRALGVLLRSLDEVMAREDFGLRIDLHGRDEFGRIGASINALLGYTDDVVHQKDLLASTDPLTRLGNRRHFIERSTPELARADRHGERVALVMCDLDHFKSVNDRFGHARGDEVLRRFAAVLTRDRRGSDLVARWGGEEFVILLAEAEENEAQGLVERLRGATEQADFGEGLRVTASFGVAYRRPSESLDALVSRADGALCRAKSAGRNRVVVER